MRYTIELYDYLELVGKYNVDTKNKTLEVVFSSPKPFLNTDFTYVTFKEFLEGRMVDLNRVDRDELLGYRQVRFSVWNEMKKTHGYDFDDFIWVKFVGIDDDNLSIVDFHPRLTEGVSVYE